MNRTSRRSWTAVVAGALALVAASCTTPPPPTSSTPTQYQQCITSPTCKLTSFSTDPSVSPNAIPLAVSNHGGVVLWMRTKDGLVHIEQVGPKDGSYVQAAVGPDIIGAVGSELYGVPVAVVGYAVAPTATNSIHYVGPSSLFTGGLMVPPQPPGTSTPVAVDPVGNEALVVQAHPATGTEELYLLNPVQPYVDLGEVPSCTRATVDQMGDAVWGPGGFCADGPIQMRSASDGTITTLGYGSSPSISSEGLRVVWRDANQPHVFTDQFAVWDATSGLTTDVGGAAGTDIGSNFAVSSDGRTALAETSPTLALPSGLAQFDLTTGVATAIPVPANEFIGGAPSEFFVGSVGGTDVIYSAYSGPTFQSLDLLLWDQP
jgi:hypothetical protein